MSLGFPLEDESAAEIGGPEVLVAKETIKAIDDENWSITRSVLEGDLKSMYKSFDLKMQVTPDGEEGSLVKWTFYFEKEHEDHPHPHPYLELYSHHQNI
ncbi:hypothetical protein Sjap_024777 [Stephania japonica]|uniref:Bet v I/Major latex protein domain-containing protein n=1 Tax=Stephania japonica TaxID=461633 RepID=A0AAP0EDZ7_9MAGN